MSKAHDEGPQAFIQFIYICPKCSFRSYGQFIFQAEDAVTKEKEQVKCCPKCYMEHMRSLNLPEMVEWRGD